MVADCESTPGHDNWANPPHALVLPEDEVHVWRASLEAPGTRIAELRCILSGDELGRANRYLSKSNGRRFLVARALLRTILGRYLGVRPTALFFDYGRNGKPELAQGCNPGGLRFNLSHTGNIAIYAITRNRAVGIDIEDPSRTVDMQPIVRRNCSKQEQADLKSVPEELQQQAFFTCWTRKEAYIKARGDGLSAHLNQITVSLVPGEPARLIDTPEGKEEAARWTIKEINVGSGYVAALIAEGHNWTLRNWGWSW